MHGAEPELRVTIIVAPERYDAVVEALAGAGVRIDESFTAIGVVSGRVPPALVTAVTDLDGVLAVEPERDMRLDF
jgi:hypothetical protein